jgi:hypothetical protein
VTQSQGQPGSRTARRFLHSALALCLAASVSSAQSAPAPCRGPALQFTALAPGLWLVPAAAGDADASNRGQVSNLFVALDGQRVWLLGSGPSPRFGRRLACQVRQLLGRPVSDVISPWPHPEAVLGLAGLGPVRSWAHAEVAAAMRKRCPDCVPRLRARLGAAAADLAGDPVRVPGLTLQGAAGRLGPWRWWLLHRSPDQPVTVWQLGDAPLGLAPGLLWSPGVPDGRDADVRALADATAHLPTLASSAAWRWVGEQGGPLPAVAAAQQARYWELLLQAVEQSLARGEADSGVPPPITGLEREATDPLHALNWQRAFRQLEAGLLQRSLR